jgi:hypothetical protein
MRELQTRTSFEWIQADSGRTYLCPSGAIRDRDGASERELRSACVDESQNPHND